MELPQGAINVVSNISETNQPVWKVSAAAGNDRKDLKFISLLDEAHGWVGGHGAMYKTSDGGQSWERVNIGMSPSTVATGMAFSTSHAWIALQKQAPDPSRYQENQIELMRASDGGQSWQPQNVYEHAFVTRISFVKEEGWLTGLKYVGTGRFDTSFLILHTSDEGQHWVDVSDNLNKVAGDEKGYVTGLVTDFVAEGPLAATVITSQGQLFNTDDGGKSWRRIGRGADDSLIFDMSACCLGFTPGKLRWVVGGEHGVEGTGSTFAVEQSQGLWQRYYLGGINLKGVLFLSDKNIMACGFIFPKDSRNDFNKTEGMILYSSDGGHNWSVVYRNAQINSINALAPVNSKHVWAVGDRGLILDLENISSY
jgi:photosystem II stability/assembly factor-like uncharacterized protein